MANLTASIMRSQKRAFVAVLSLYYAATADEVAEFEDVWDWRLLSRNKNLAWTDELVDKFARRWEWKELDSNPAVPWSASFIRKHVKAKRLSWGSLRWQAAVLREREMAVMCLSEWSRMSDFPDRDSGPYTPCSFNKWGDGTEAWPREVVAAEPQLNWAAFSAVAGFPWTLDFIEEHADRLAWRALSWNSGLPWSVELFDRFGDRLEWDHLSYGIDWTLDMLDAVKDRINWRSVQIEHCPPEVFDAFPDRLYWARPDYDHGYWEGSFSGAINDKRLEWTPERYERFGPHVEAHLQQRFAEMEEDDEDDLESDERPWTQWCDTSHWSAELFELVGDSGVDWSEAARHAKTPWTPEFIERNREHLMPELYGLAYNSHFPLTENLEWIAPHLDNRWKAVASSAAFHPTEALIEQYRDHWDWAALSKNPNLDRALIDRYADELDWDRLAGGEAITLDDVSHYKDRWTALAWRRLSSHEFAVQGDIDVELPWNWEELTRKGRDVNVHLEADEVADFLVTVRTGRTMERNYEIEASLAENLADASGFAVYGDWLLTRGDVQGDLIALIHAAGEDPSREEEVQAAISRYTDQLELQHYTPMFWRLGFVDEIYELRLEWKRLLPERPFRFIRGLGFSEDVARTMTGKDSTVLSVLTCLERLNVRYMGTADWSVLRPLTNLRDLRLDHTQTDDLTEVARLPRLEQLSIWNTSVTDLTPLARMKTLTSLHIGHCDIKSVGPLAELPQLIEIDLRFTDVNDLRPLHRLKSLRRVWLDDTPVSEGQRDALSKAVPEVTFVDYRDWPAGSTLLPFWDRKYRAPLPEPAAS